MDLKEFIRKWKISGVLIAEKIGMPQGTFNNKFRPNQTVYRFTPEEEEKIKEVLLELAKDIYKEFVPPYMISFKFEVTEEGQKFLDNLKSYGAGDPDGESNELGPLATQIVNDLNNNHEREPGKDS